MISNKRRNVKDKKTDTVFPPGKTGACVKLPRRKTKTADLFVIKRCQLSRVHEITGGILSKERGNVQFPGENLSGFAACFI